MRSEAETMLAGLGFYGDWNEYPQLAATVKETALRNSAPAEQYYVWSQRDERAAYPYLLLQEQVAIFLCFLFYRWLI